MPLTRCQGTIADSATDQATFIDPGHTALFEPTVKYDLERKGAKNILFGGEGLFLARLNSPGRVWPQSIPLANLAAAIRKLIPSGQ